MLDEKWIGERERAEDKAWLFSLAVKRRQKGKGKSKLISSLFITKDRGASQAGCSE